MTKEIKKNRIAKFFKDSSNFTDFMDKYCHYLHKVIMNLKVDEIENVIRCFINARERGSTIFFAGNGGSAATASHFAQDLAEVGKKVKTENFRVLSLTENMPFITALGNDYGYDMIFTGQMANLFKEGDVFVAISASGNSPNIVKAAKMAKDMQGITVALVGFDGGELAGMCDYVIHVKTNKGEYGTVEDIHLMVNHIITQYIMYSLFPLKNK